MVSDVGGFFSFSSSFSSRTSVDSLSSMHPRSLFFLLTLPLCFSLLLVDCRQYMQTYIYTGISLEKISLSSFYVLERGKGWLDGYTMVSLHRWLSILFLWDNSSRQMLLFDLIFLTHFSSFSIILFPINSIFKWLSHLLLIRMIKINHFHNSVLLFVKCSSKVTSLALIYGDVFLF